MKIRTLHFKFKKKSKDLQTENNSINKNYEIIYNNILNDAETYKTPNSFLQNMHAQFTINTKNNNKNKIKHISKLNSLNVSDKNHPNIISNKIEKIKTPIIRNNNNNKENNTIISHNNKSIKINTNNFKNKNFKNQSKKIMSKKLNVSLTQHFKFEKNMISAQYKSSSNSYSKKGKIVTNSHSKKDKIDSTIKKYNKIKYITAKKIPAQRISFIKPNTSHDIERNLLTENKKNNNKIEMNLNQKNKQFLTEKVCLTQKKYLNSIKKHVFRKYGKIVKNKKNFFKKLSPHKLKIFINKNKKNNKLIEYFNKITITDNNLKSKSIISNDNLNKIKNINYTFNHNISEKKLLLNNTNSNINININNLNDNNSNTNKKESEYIIYDLTSKSNCYKNILNNNIDSVSIINNNNDNDINNNKLKENNLIFYNHINKINSPYLDKLNPKRIKVQSININLGEELDKNNYGYNNNNISNNNSTNNNCFKEHNNTNETEVEKETKSEYEHYRNLEDFLSNRSLTSLSCKSGFTITRKLRSLSRERNKIKLLNKCKNNEKDLRIMGDKLLNIVNNFHNNNNNVINFKINNNNNINEIKKILKIKNYNSFAFHSKNNKMFYRKKL